MIIIAILLLSLLLLLLVSLLLCQSAFVHAGLLSGFDKDRAFEAIYKDATTEPSATQAFIEYCRMTRSSNVNSWCECNVGFRVSGYLVSGFADTKSPETRDLAKFAPTVTILRVPWYRIEDVKV